jgi:putative transcriptional regulator
MVGIVGEKLFSGVFVWRGGLPRFVSVRRSNGVRKVRSALPADPADAEDFDVTAEALERGQRAHLIRMTRTTLGLSQSEFANRFRVPVGTLLYWEQARVTAPDFAIAYVRDRPASGYGGEGRCIRDGLEAIVGPDSPPLR